MNTPQPKTDPTLRAAVAATPGELAEQVARLARAGYVCVLDVATYELDNGMFVLPYLVQVMRKTTEEPKS